MGCPTLAQWDVFPDFMPHTEASGPRDFQAMRLEKTLVLAWALQTCTEGSGVPTGILCNCMPPLITLSRDYIVEASLLKPTKEKHGTSPTLEEEAILMGKEPEATSLAEHPEISEPSEPSKQIGAQSARSTECTDNLSMPPSPSPTPQPGCHSSQKANKP